MDLETRELDEDLVVVEFTAAYVSVPNGEDVAILEALRRYVRDHADRYIGGISVTQEDADGDGAIDRARWSVYFHLLNVGGDP